MENSFYDRMLDVISGEREAFDILVSADDVNGYGVKSSEIINFLEYSSNEQFMLKDKIFGNILITEGDIMSILLILNDLCSYNGEYLLYINNTNMGTITYLVKVANHIYESVGLNVHLQIEYSKNYNNYINEDVSIVGCEELVMAASKDFNNPKKIII